MLNQDHNVWCSSSFIQQTFKGQKWELGFSFYQPVHNQVPHRAVPPGDWNCQDTHPSPSLSFKHQGLVCAPLWQEHCSPTQGSGEGLLQQDAQISEHKLAAAPVVVTCGSPETLLLPPCSSLLCLIIKKGEKEALCNQTPHRANLTAPKLQKSLSQWNSSLCLHNSFHFQGRKGIFEVLSQHERLLTPTTTPWFRWDNAPDSPVGVSASLTQVSFGIASSFLYTRYLIQKLQKPWNTCQKLIAKPADLSHATKGRRRTEEGLLGKLSAQLLLQSPERDRKSLLSVFR